MSKNLKVIKLVSENYKKLKAIEIEPKGNVVMITGKNGHGKTSILDSILVALNGKDKNTIKPVREGEERAIIKLDMDEIEITRVFSNKGTTKLEVISKDGAKYSSPQDFLNKLIGKLSFDPLQFANKCTGEQRAILYELANITDKIEELSDLRKVYHDKRYNVGVEGKALARNTEEEIKESKEYKDQKEINITTVAEKYKREFGRHTIYENAQLGIIRINKEIKELELEKLAFLDVKDTKEDLRELKKNIDEADETNNKIRNANSILQSNDEVLAKEKKYKGFTAKIKGIEEEKIKLLKNAKMPIKGLSVNDDGVFYNNIPYNQLSTSEKLKVGISIAMGMNPDIRVIRILDGSLLDDDNMKVVEEMTKGKDYQVWIEKVDSTGKIGFYIEDGEVKKIN